MLSMARPGCRAEVVFGKNKKYAGIIKKLVDVEPSYKTKDLLNIIDEEPLVHQQQLNLWEWMSQYYMCSEGEVMAAALPANFKLSSETILLYNEESGEDFSGLSDNEFIVAEALLVRKQLGLTEVQHLLETNLVYPVIKKLLEKNICFAWEEMSEKYKARTETYIELNPAYSNETKLEELLNSWKGAPRQLELVLAFLHLHHTEGEVSKTELLKKSGATPAQFKALCDKGILFARKRNIDRITALPKKVIIDFELNEFQKTAFESIRENFLSKPTCLLHGVTGSGKTEIYIRLIADFLERGKEVLYLLPEIALTTQIIRRLQKHFGGNIAIYHSRFNNQERVELWNKIRKGEIKIVLGARSALFLPFTNLGLIIVDEEHDASFKQQDPAPRYNARDAAIFYASGFESSDNESAKVLLGSATPSLESYFNATNGKYGLVKLNERFGGIELPEIKIIDNRQVAARGKVMISPALQEAIEKTITGNRQVILFQNRRGYNPYMICAACGFIPQCAHCDVSLTLHKYSNKLHCHYCGSTYPRIIECPACGTNKWLEKNFGTEKIEEQLESDFTGYRIARMDVDSVRGKNAHDQLIQSFEQQRLDILVGTQMVVKGLDFEHVNLVGILDADGLLSFADFRVNERAFQLMEQVSGRAGRKHGRGEVLIQAININHPVLQLVKAHDYKNLFNMEIASRKEFFYPPFSRLVRITMKHKDADIVSRAADKIFHSLHQDLAQYLVGPSTPVIGRLRNQYLKEILIKLPKETGMGLKYKQVIRNHLNLVLSEKDLRSVHVIIDVDPM